MYLGERIETIISARRTGAFGEYVGGGIDNHGRDYRLAKVDGVVYKVTQNIEVDQGWYWQVTNMNSWKTESIQDKYDLARFNG